MTDEITGMYFMSLKDTESDLRDAEHVDIANSNDANVLGTFQAAMQKAGDAQNWNSFFLTDSLVGEERTTVLYVNAGGTNRIVHVTDEADPIDNIDEDEDDPMTVAQFMALPFNDVVETYGNYAFPVVNAD